MTAAGQMSHERRVAIVQHHLEAYARENAPAATIKSTPDGR